MGIQSCACQVLLVSVALPCLLSLVLDGWARQLLSPTEFDPGKDIPDLTGKIAIVTGTSTGSIGFETAAGLARQGAHVILAMRDLAKGEVALKDIRRDLVKRKAKGIVETMHLDLGSLRSVRSFADAFKQRRLPLHILVNNAGVANCPFGLTEDGIEMQFGTNHVGHFLLTLLVVENLRASAPSRIVTVSSSMAFLSDFVDVNLTDVFEDSKATYSSWRAYTRSKLANILFSHELAKRLEDTGVYVNSCHPGGVATNIQSHTYSQFQGVIGEALTAFLQSFLEYVMMTPKDGALTTLFLAGSSEVEHKGIHGQYFHPQARNMTPPSLVEPKLQKELWEFSSHLITHFRH